MCSAFSTLSFFFSSSSGDLLTCCWTSGSRVTAEHLVLFQSDSRFLLRKSKPKAKAVPKYNYPNPTASTGLQPWWQDAAHHQISKVQTRNPLDEKPFTALHSQVLSQCNQHCASITRESGADPHDCRSSVSISEALAHVARSQNHGRTSAASRDH